MHLRRLLAALLLLLARPDVLMAQAPLDPCLECGRLYASAGPGDLWLVDVDAGTSTFLGTSFPNFTDIGITTDGRIFGMSFDADLYLVSACDASASFFDPNFYGNALTGDPDAPDDLYVAGPPLGRIDTATGSVTFIGGNVTGPPPLWCGPSSGDIAVDPETGLMLAALQCSCPMGDTLVLLDPATGDALQEIGCIQDAAGVGYTVFGLAFTDDCRLIGGGPFGPVVLDIDPETAVATPIPIAGGYDGAFGMDLLRCPTAPSCGTVVEERCEPLTQGFWKRQCRGPHPSGEHDRLDAHAACASATRTFAGRGTREQACQALNPEPERDKCLQAEAQFMALLMNTCSGRLGRTCCIDTPLSDATTVGEAIDEIDALLSDPLRSFRDCVQAQALADAINTGEALCDGSSSSRLTTRRVRERPTRSDRGSR